MEVWANLVIFHCILIFTCLLNIVGSLKMFKYILIPFIIIELMRLLCILAAHIVFMMVIKVQLNLGVHIAVTTAGGFLIRKSIESIIEENSLNFLFSVSVLLLGHIHCSLPDLDNGQKSKIQRKCTKRPPKIFGSAKITERHFHNLIRSPAHIR